MTQQTCFLVNTLSNKGHWSQTNPLRMEVKTHVINNEKTTGRTTFQIVNAIFFHT